VLVVHDEHFKRQDVYDPEVIRECGANGWFLLTGDDDLTRRWSREIAEAKIGVFCQTNNHHGPKLWVPRICSVKASMIRMALREPRPFIALISAQTKPELKKKRG